MRRSWDKTAKKATAPTVTAQVRILMEIKDLENISFKFTHQKLREFVYMKQSEGRKKLLHNKANSLLDSMHHNSHHVH